MNISVNYFKSNNPDKKITDFVPRVEAGVDDKDIGHIHIRTTDKYVYLDANAGSVWLDEGRVGQLINIKPILYEKDDSGYSIELADVDWMKYINHEDYWCVELALEAESLGLIQSTALKHEYHITCLKHDDWLNYDCLEQIELEE